MFSSPLPLSRYGVQAKMLLNLATTSVEVFRCKPISLFFDVMFFFQVIASTLEPLGQNGANAAHLVEVAPTSEHEHLSRESEALARELMSPKKVFATQRSVLPSLANLSAQIGVSGALAV